MSPKNVFSLFYSPISVMFCMLESFISININDYLSVIFLFVVGQFFETFLNVLIGCSRFSSVKLILFHIFLLFLANECILPSFVIKQLFFFSPIVLYTSVKLFPGMGFKILRTGFPLYKVY